MNLVKSACLAVTIAFMCTLSSCATLMNVDNNKAFKMGLDVVMESPAPITVTINGKTARHKKIYQGEGYYAYWVYLDKARENFVITITQNGETRSRKVHGDKVKGLFWFTGLFVILDHATGALRQYPAIVFEDMESPVSGK